MEDKDNYIDFNEFKEKTSFKDINIHRDKTLDKYIDNLNSNSQKLINTMEKLEGKKPEELKEMYNNLVLRKEKK